MAQTISKTLNTKDEIREFIASHAGEIRGLYYDSFYKMGGWNGMMYAINEVEKRNGVEISLNDNEGNEDEVCNDEAFEKIIQEELNS